MNLPQLPQDKANHFVYGAAAAYAGAALAAIAGATIAIVLIAGFAAVWAVAVGKEVYDRVSATGTPDVWDTLATVAGGAAVLLPGWLIAHWLQ